jgi:hypothetical protein
MQGLVPGARGHGGARARVVLACSWQLRGCLCFRPPQRLCVVGCLRRLPMAMACQSTCACLRCQSSSHLAADQVYGCLARAGLMRIVATVQVVWAG